MPRARRCPALCLLMLALALPCAPAAAQDEVTTLDRIQVTATRTPRDPREVPAAISVVDVTAGEGTGGQLSGHLQGLPGVLARSRQNYAQDEQISIRGFGTRASFGIRGVRLFVDGVPATMPDGQGQVSHFPLFMGGRIEVLRGPFSVLYGNAAGGVVQLFTGDARAPGDIEAGVAGGAFDTWRGSFVRRDATDGDGDAGEGEPRRVGYAVGVQHFRTGGYREHSRAERTTFHGKTDIGIGDTRLTLTANALHAPDAQDPQGLDRAQFAADPRAASAGALRFDTRKSTSQRQLGAVLTRVFGDAGELRVQAHAGVRDVEQYLSIPVGTQCNPLSGGGVIDLHAPFAGVDLRWSRDAALAGRPLHWVIGIDHQRQDQERRGYENFVSDGVAGDTLGVRGALRLRQSDRVTSTDPYLQASWDVADAWTLMGGVRRSTVRFRSRDRYVTEANPDDSGAVRHRATSPVFGVTWRPSPAWRLFASWGRGFETPTFNELGYRADGGSGLNFALHPARTRSAEAGIRHARGGASTEVVVFRADTRDEITVNTSSGGRTTYRNVGRARREGVEWSGALPLRSDWRAEFALTWLDARFEDDFLACAGTPCTVPSVPVAAGTRIPGVPRTMAALALRWGDRVGWHARFGVQHVGDVTVNHAGDERAAGYTVADASAGWGFRRAADEGRIFLSVENLFDRRYAGSVIVNEGNRRYYEAAPDRHLVLGLEWRWRDRASAGGD